MSDKDCMNLQYIGSTKIQIDLILKELIMITSKIPNPAKEFGCEPFIVFDNSRVKCL